MGEALLVENTTSEKNFSISISFNIFRAEVCSIQMNRNFSLLEISKVCQWFHIYLFNSELCSQQEIFVCIIKPTKWIIDFVKKKNNHNGNVNLQRTKANNPMTSKRFILCAVMVFTFCHCSFQLSMRAQDFITEVLPI